jgi:hypothetical protein
VVRLYPRKSGSDLVGIAQSFLRFCLRCHDLGIVVFSRKVSLLVAPVPPWDIVGTLLLDIAPLLSFLPSAFGTSISISSAQVILLCVAMSPSVSLDIMWDATPLSVSLGWLEGGNLCYFISPMGV